MTLSARKKTSDKLTPGPLPLYYQVADEIRNGILIGNWNVGNQLPTEEDLAKEYGVSRQTIRNAKEILAKEGFINSVRGSGCYVNSQETWKTVLPTVENLNDIFHYGSKMSFRIHEFGMVSNTEEIQVKLENPQDRFVFQIKGTRWFKGRPISYVNYYLPFKLGSRIPLECLDENPFIPQFEKLAGIQVLEGVQNIALDRADATVAMHLGRQEGDAVLVVKTVYFDDQNQPIEYIESRYCNELPYAIRVKRN